MHSPDELEIPTTANKNLENLIDIPNCLIDKIITVDERSIVAAADVLLKEENLNDVTGAIGLAAILDGKLDELKGKR